MGEKTYIQHILYPQNFCSSVILRNCLYFLLLCVGDVIPIIPGTEGSETSSCKFPSFLDPSFMYSTYNVEGTNMNAYFKGGFMSGSRCYRHRDNCSKFKAKCVSKREDNKFQMQTITSSSEIPKFYCIQILKRSDSIVQVRRSSEQAYLAQNACNDEHLILDNWPMMTLYNFYKQKIPCPFTGGYNIRFQTSEKKPKCDKEITPTRLESECEDGDGMTIQYHSTDCMEEDLGMRMEQSLYCAATWTHGNVTFVVIRPQEEEFKAWCMRLEGTDMTRVTKGQIFIHFVCDPGDGYGNLRETSNYLHIEFERRVVSSTCADSYEFCDERRLCRGEVYNIHCRKFCGICGGSQPRCNFPSHLDGVWMENDIQQNNLRITAYEMTIGKKAKFECHEDDPEHDFKNNTLLLQTFSNGCFPRYACLQVSKPCPSLLEYRLGNRVSWPIKDVDRLKEHVCDDDMFLANTKDKEVYGRDIEDKPSKIVIDTSYRIHVDCELDGWISEQLYIQDETEGCDYCLLHVQKRHDDDRVISQPLNCTGKSTKGNMVQRQYHCLGTFQQDEYTHAIVTRTLHVHEEYLCWVFREDFEQRTDIKGEIDVLNHTYCNSVAIKSLKAGHIKPIRSFVIPKERTCPRIRVEEVHTTTSNYYNSPKPDPYNPDPYPNPWDRQERPDTLPERPEWANEPFSTTSWNRPRPLPTTHGSGFGRYDPNRRPPAETEPVSDNLSALAVPLYPSITITVIFIVLNMFMLCT